MRKSAPFQIAGKLRGISTDNGFKQVQIAYLAVISNLERLVPLSYTLSMQIRPLANPRQRLALWSLTDKLNFRINKWWCVNDFRLQRVNMCHVRVAYGWMGLSWKIWTPPKMDTLVQIFRNIWTPGPDISKYWTSMELIFQELDEIFRLPMKFLDPSLQKVNRLFWKFITISKGKIVKTQYTKHQTITKLKY